MLAVKAFDDQELREYVDRVERYGALMGIDGAAQIRATWERLLRERDEARRVARVLAESDLCSPKWEEAYRATRDYPSEAG